MTIKEIEERTGLPRANVRFYESEGLIAPSRGSNGYRDYSEADCQTLLKIKLLRQLDCPLEDIRALQSGELRLDSVLSQRLDALKYRQAGLSRAQQLCQQLWDDRAEWDTIQPERYLTWVSPVPASPEVEDIRHQIPWRRFLARGLDFALCSFLWRLFLALALRVNITQRGGYVVLDFAISMALQLLLEPLFLHRFGTTPGKALFGLRLTRSDGSYFSWQEALQRTGTVLLMGEGLMIPIVSTITNGLGLYRCCHQLEQPWALEDEAWSDGTDGRTRFWDAPRAGWRAAGYVGVQVLMIVLLSAASLFAYLPFHHGALTVAQFADNYNHLLRYQNAPDRPSLLLDEDGAWFDNSDTIVIDLFSSGGPPEFQFEVEDETITRVSFSAGSSDSSGFHSLPYSQTVHTIQALLGKVALKDTLYDQLMALLEADPGTVTQSVDGWTLTRTLRLEGYQVYDGILVPQDGAAQSFYYEFTMEQT